MAKCCSEETSGETMVSICFLSLILGMLALIIVSSVQIHNHNVQVTECKDILSSRSFACFNGINQTITETRAGYIKAYQFATVSNYTLRVYYGSGEDFATSEERISDIYSWFANSTDRTFYCCTEDLITAYQKCNCEPSIKYEGWVIGIIIPSLFLIAIPFCWGDCLSNSRIR